MTQPSLTCLILAGGTGSRLWPLSQPEQPKPCLTLPFLDDSLLSLTLQRVQSLTPTTVRIITHADCADAIQANMTNHPAAELIIEPATRNTAPAIALALNECTWDDESLCLILPSDQVLEPLDAFSETVRQAQAYMHAHPEYPFLLFGLTPTHPSSRFGYIATQERITGGSLPGAALCMTSFIEKPEAQQALAMMAQPGTYWNSGIILCRPKALQTLLSDAGCHGQRDQFMTMPALSIDHALWHDKAHAGVMMPLHCQWHDVGTWPALLNLAAQQPEHQAALSAGTMVINTEKDKPVRCVGVDNLLVVNTPDGLLIMNRNAMSERPEQVSAHAYSEG